MYDKTTLYEEVGNTEDQCQTTRNLHSNFIVCSIVTKGGIVY